MTKDFFFQKKNKDDGTLLEETFSVSDEKQARAYYNSKRFYKYLGWSDNRFMLELRKNIPQLKLRKDKNGMPLDVSEAVKKKLRQAQKDSLEFAKNNEDKSVPRALSSLQYARSNAEANWKKNNNG